MSEIEDLSQLGVAAMLTSKIQGFPPFIPMDEFPEEFQSLRSANVYFIADCMWLPRPNVKAIPLIVAVTIEGVIICSSEGKMELAAPFHCMSRLYYQIKKQKSIFSGKPLVHIAIMMKPEAGMPAHIYFPCSTEDSGGQQFVILMSKLMVHYCNEAPIATAKQVQQNLDEEQQIAFLNDPSRNIHDPDNLRRMAIGLGDSDVSIEEIVEKGVQEAEESAVQGEADRARLLMLNWSQNLNKSTIEMVEAKEKLNLLIINQREKIEELTILTGKGFDEKQEEYTKLFSEHAKAKKKFSKIEKETTDPINKRHELHDTYRKLKNTLESAIHNKIKEMADKEVQETKETFSLTQKANSKELTSLSNDLNSLRNESTKHIQSLIDRLEGMDTPYNEAVPQENELNEGIDPNDMAWCGHNAHQLVSKGPNVSTSDAKELNSVIVQYHHFLNQWERSLSQTLKLSCYLETVSKETEQINEDCINKFEDYKESLAEFETIKTKLDAVMDKYDEKQYRF